MAVENCNTQIEVIHLVAALLDDQAGLARSVVDKAGGDMVSCNRAVQKALVRVPRQDPAPVCFVCETVLV